ncbi:MAG: Uma2 family endonuclease [Spirochaetes bacterium]|nr:Uma2 family endonuclease [Spirochaetota bacterium]
MLVAAPSQLAPPGKPRYHGLRVTREIYLDLEDDGFKYDVIDGVMVMAPSGFFEHGETAASLSFLFYNYLKMRPVGKLTSEVDIFLPDGGDPLRPDLSFILNENLYIVAGHIHGTPDLVVEILSPSTLHRDLGVKAERYLKNGVREYWIADPAEKALQVWINKGDHWEKRTGDTLASMLLEGLVIKRAEVWD